MDPITPADVRYIKLGQGGAWAATSLNHGEVHFGYPMVPHEICRVGDWDTVAECLSAAGLSRRSAASALREIQSFYALGDECLWITFAVGHLWWAFADSRVIWNGESTDGTRGARMRRTIDGWRNANIRGEPLRMDQLSSKLTQVAAYRQTICAVKEEAYLLRRINGVEEPIVTRARAARRDMAAAAAAMITGLHWADFETLVDLIFSRSGWQRVSRVGGDQADTDLILEQPTTGERAGVQVKSSARQDAIHRFVDHCRANYDRLFFICHSPKSDFTTEGEPNLHVWAGPRLADAVVKAGLFDWLVERSR